MIDVGYIVCQHVVTSYICCGDQLQERAVRAVCVHHNKYSIESAQTHGHGRQDYGTMSKDASDLPTRPINSLHPLGHTAAALASCLGLALLRTKVELSMPGPSVLPDRRSRISRVGVGLRVGVNNGELVRLVRGDRKGETSTCLVGV